MLFWIDTKVINEAKITLYDSFYYFNKTFHGAIAYMIIVRNI